jgi:hypothetical protein
MAQSGSGLRGESFDDYRLSGKLSLIWRDMLLLSRCDDRLLNLPSHSLLTA